jgi:hypothetical protein
MKESPLLTRLRRPAARQAGVLLLALSFLLVASGEVLGAHHCAHHQGEHAASGAHADAPPDGGHDGHQGAHPPAQSVPHDHDPAPCTCIGTCHGSAATPLPPSVQLSVAPAAGAVGAAHLPQGESRAVRLLPHVLPFANGPPTVG